LQKTEIYFSHLCLLCPLSLCTLEDDIGCDSITLCLSDCLELLHLHLLNLVNIKATLMNDYLIIWLSALTIT